MNKTIVKIRKSIKSFIWKNNLLFNIYTVYVLKKKRGTYLEFISKYSKDNRNKGIKFVHLGANDGIWDDPIFRFIRRDNWKGILVEPQKNIFQRLEKNYGKTNNLIFENCAVSDKRETKKLYKISFSDSPWASCLSRFNEESLKALVKSGYVEKRALEENIKMPNDLSKCISFEIVECYTLPEILNKHNFLNFDVLVVDIEGYEDKIIFSIDFNVVKPKVILYEHTHQDTALKEKCKNYLIKNGYNILVFESDILAYIN